MSPSSSKRDLVEALADLVDVDPEEHTGEGRSRCHYCLRARGFLHESTCAWIGAAVLLRGDADILGRRVGEDEDDFEDRVAEDDEPEEDPRAQLATLAAEARSELAVLKAEPVDDDPLDEPTEWPSQIPDRSQIVPTTKPTEII